jgi:hypothetical protein
MCTRFVYTTKFVNCTAQPKHVITKYDPQPPCGKPNCGDIENERKKSHGAGDVVIVISESQHLGHIPPFLVDWPICWSSLCVHNWQWWHIAGCGSRSKPSGSCHSLFYCQRASRRASRASCNFTKFIAEKTVQLLQSLLLPGIDQ